MCCRTLLCWHPDGGCAVPLTRGRILVVEDEPDIRALLCEVLAEEGYAVTTAANGAEALDTLAELRAGDEGPDLIVLDHRMPVLDGPNFLAAYRALPGPHAPVLLSTSQPDPGIEGVAYLRRPFDLRV